MQVALRLTDRPPADGLLYSYNELARSLRRAGFVDLAPYWAVPHPRYPREFIPLLAVPVREAHHRLRKDLVSERSTVLLSWLPSCVLRRVTKGLVFIARKPS
jgi:hypothetical protein